MYPLRTVLLYSGTATNATAGIGIPLGSQYTAAIFRLKITAATGTSPTLNVIIQDGVRVPPSGATVGRDVDGETYEWDDYAAFLQATGTGAQKIRVVGGGEEVHVELDGTLTAGSVRNGPIGNVLRVKPVVGGTNPGFTFTVVVQFIP